MQAEFFRSMIASLGEGVLVLDSSDRILYANPSTEKLLGEVPIGATFTSWVSDVLGAHDVAAAQLPPNRALREDEPAPVDIFVGRTGLRVNILSRPMRAVTGELRGSVSIIRDVTAERHSEAELRRARIFIDSIVENIPDMIFVKDAEGLRFERFNRAGEELLGIPRSELLGKSDFDFFPRDQAEFFQERDRETLLRGKLVDIEEEPIDTKSGRRWLHTKKIPIRDEHGHPKYLLGISSDITARRAAEEALKKAHDELERRVVERTEELRRTEEQLRHVQKLEAVGRLAGGVAHDFNNVLAVIMGQVGFLFERFEKDASILDELRPIRDAAEHAAALTKQLLAFSRKQVMQPQTTNLNSIVERTRGMLSRLLSEDIELVSHLSPSLGVVHVDAALVEQVIVNLAVNARDAMPDGGKLTISTEGVRLPAADPSSSLPAGEYVLLRVTDTGIGMDEPTRARAFEPFFTTKALGRGTGLGLSVAYGVVSQSGGSIDILSRPGEGTTFCVYLPCVQAHRAVAAPGPPASVTRGGGETILVAEDEGPLRKVLRTILQNAGYHVLDAGTGREALALAQTHDGPIHLLLSDVVMPAMDGPELARRLVAVRPTARVLFMSGYAGEKLADHALSTDRLLAKPFTPETLTSRVRQVLDAGPGVEPRVPA